MLKSFPHTFSFLILIIIILIPLNTPIEQFDNLSPGTRVKTTPLLDNSIFVLFTESSKSHFLIIDKDGFITTEATQLTPDSPITYSDNSNLKAISLFEVVIIDNKNLYVFDYTSNTIIKSKTWSSENSSLPLIALAVNVNSNIIIIGNSVNNKGTMYCYNKDLELQQTESLTRDAATTISNYVECAIFPDSPNLTVCLFSKTSSSHLISYTICEQGLTNCSKEQSNSDGNTGIEFKSNNVNIGFQIVSLRTNLMVLCGLETESSGQYLFCLSFKQDNNNIIKVAVPNDSYASVYHCQNIWTATSIINLSETQFGSICVEQNNIKSFKYSIVNVHDSDNKMSHAKSNTGFTINSDITFANAVAFANGVMGVIYTKNDNVYLQYLYHPNCGDYDVGTLTENTNTNLDFSSYAKNAVNVDGNLYVKVTPHDINDSTKNSVKIKINNADIDENEFYNLNALTLNAGNVVGMFAYTFTIGNSQKEHFKQCKLTIEVKRACYIGCLTCDSMGTSDAMKCTLCDTNNEYYPKNTDTSASEYNCYTEETIGDGYYLSSDNTWHPCFEGCKTCTTFGNKENTQCTSCDNDNGYYELEDKPSHCVDKTKQIDKYYADHGLKKFVKCYNGCLTCSAKGTSVSNTKCDTCDVLSEYYSLTTNIEQCYHKDSKINHYYFICNTTDATDITCSFEPCHTSCLTCDEQYSTQFTKCELCDKSNNYFPLEDDETQCHKSDEDVMGYFFNASQQKFLKCSIACKKCSQKEQNGKTNCDVGECANNYAPVVSDKTQCYPKTQKGIDYLYYNINTELFEYCYASCKTCDEYGSETNSKCISCDVSKKYYPLENDGSKCFNVNTKPQNTFLSGNVFVLCHESCLTCNSKGTENNSKCLACDNDSGYYAVYNDESNCINEEIKNNYHPDKYLDYYTQKYQQCGSECGVCSKGKNKCDKCANGFYFLEGNHTQICLNEETKFPTYHNYYLDTQSQPQVYKQCYINCDTCSELGNENDNKCKTCIEGMMIHPTKPTHCTQPCAFYYYLSGGNADYTCVDKCEGNYHYIYENEKKCSGECVLPKLIYGNYCVDECPEDTEKDSNSNECVDMNRCRLKESESSTPKDSVADIIDELGENYAIGYLQTDKVIHVVNHVSNKYTITIFKSKECAESLLTNLVVLDMSVCINLLKQHYNIPEDMDLITLQMDIQRENQSNQVAYTYYHPISGIRLDLEICAEEKVEVKVPIKETPEIDVQEALDFKELGVDVYNISDPFFNDICINYGTDGKDTTINDRREHYYQNPNFCEDGCEYKGVHLDTLEADCLCEVKTDFLTEVLDNPITGEMLELFSVMNFDVIKCYKKVFQTKSFIKNIGGWVIIGFMIMQVGFMVIYIMRGLKDVRGFVGEYVPIAVPPKKKKVNDLILKPHDNQTNKINKVNEDNNNNINTNNNNNNDMLSNRIKYYDEDSKMKPSEKLFMKDDCFSNDIFSSPDSFIQKKQPKQPKKLMLMVLNHNYQNENNFESNFESNSDSHSSKDLNPEPSSKRKLPINLQKRKPKKKIPVNPINKNVRKVILKRSKSKKGNSSQQDEEEFSDGELNEMEHYDALIYDKRTFCKFYWNQLKEKQDFINTFIDIDVLEVFPIKAICFILNVALLFTLNALLYTEEEISKRFNRDGNQNEITLMFTDNITRVIYVSMVSIVIEYIIDCLFSDKRRILIIIKRERDDEKVKDECLKAISSMKVKNLVFLIVNYIIMLLFWYYVSAFCNCYPNTVSSWIVSCFVTWGVLIILPFILCFVCAVLRFIGLKCKSEMFYKLSMCLMS